MSKDDKLLQKCDRLIDKLTELQKALGPVNVASARVPVPTLGRGWSMDHGTGALHHSTHGVISTFKTTDGGFEIKHGGKVIGKSPSLKDAATRIHDYIGKLAPHETGLRPPSIIPVAKSESTSPTDEVSRAQQLANVMVMRSMLGNAPRQPTDQEMFGHLVPSEETVEKAQRQWNGAINNWLAEASKPINSRFSSPEEEQAYWDSIKVHDSSGSRDDETGY